MKTKILKNVWLALLSVSIVTSVVYWTLGGWEGVENAADWDSLTHTVWNSLVDGVVKKTGNIAETITGNKTFSGNTTLEGKVNTTQNTTTISWGAITYNNAYVLVDNEWWAATDDLDNINGGTAGDIIVLQPITDSRDFTIKHVTGNIRTKTQTHITLSNQNDTVTLMFDGAQWVEVSRSTQTDFLATKTQNGYTYLPNGLIMQWWREWVISANSGRSVSFPVPFPTWNFVVTSTYDNASISIENPSSVSLRTTTGFTLNNGHSSSASIMWTAIGY